MVTLPKEFVAIQYPGYFWNIQYERLYSVKVTGVLKPLTFQPAGRYNHFQEGYAVSVNGNRHFLPLWRLRKLVTKPQVFPVTKIK